MKNITRTIITLLLCISLPACTTSRAVKIAPDAPASSEIHKGDRLHITFKDGRDLSLIVDRVDEKFIYGQQNTIPWNTVASIDRNEVSAAKTAGLGAGVLLAIALFSMAFAVYVIEHGAK